MSCPECKNPVKRRVKNDEGFLACPICKTAIEKVGGQWIKLIYSPPINTLYRILEKTVQKYEHNVFPYRIPQHMIIRTKKILETCWLECYPVMENMGITSDDALDLFKISFDDMMYHITPDSRELGLLLWYISGKEDTKFRKILTGHTMSKKRMMDLYVEEDNWLT